MVGSGPSAKFYKHVCQGRKVATVNAGVVDGDLDVDAYGVFEREAFPIFEERYKKMAENGVECYTRPSVKKTFETEGTAVPLQYGYDQSSEGPAGVRFCSAGCAMLNLVAKKYRPHVIHMIGFDGYDGDTKTIRYKNGSMGRHIAQITRGYPHIKFVLHGDSNLPHQHRWRVEREGKI